MRLLSGLLASGLLFAIAPVAMAEDQLPALADPVKLTANGQPIAVDTGHAAPFVLDINKDGKPDLLVGQFGGGKLRVYLNRGTAKDPKLTDFVYLQADGADISVPPS